MKTRANQGSTLSLVIACTIVIALLGIAFIFMGFIFGGHREAQHAADAGVLNVSKRAIMAPYVASSALDGDTGPALMGTITSTSGGQNLGQGINLLNFNRLVAQAMLVAMNAEADGAPEGLENAKEVYEKVEGSPTSVGAELRRLLSQPEWAQNDYNEVSGNVLRMLGGGGAPTFEPADFKVAWMNQRPGDYNASNIDMSILDSTQSSHDATASPMKSSAFDNVESEDIERASAPSSAFHKKDSVSYMAGYTPVTVAGMDFYSVPTNPGMQPHLESTAIFPHEITQPGEGKVWLPPNAFQIGATTTVTIGSDPFIQPAHAGQTATAHVYAVSIIGTPQDPFQPSIPSGYLVVDNSGDSNATSFTGSLPNTDTVAAHELGTGIIVDPTTKYFSFGNGPDGKGNLIDRWQSFDHVTGEADPTNSKTPPFKDPDYPNTKKGLFASDGKPIETLNEAAKIPYVSSSSSALSATLCTDNNSAIGGNPVCSFLNTSPDPDSTLSPFDKAFHPDSLASNGGQVSTNLATANEMSQCKVIDLYGSTPHGGGPLENYNSTFGPTGMRKYPNGLPNSANQYAWQGNPGFGQAPSKSLGGTSVSTSKSGNPCQVTEDGSLVDLLTMLEVNPDPAKQASKEGKNFKKKVLDFVVQRAKQIEPKSKTADVMSLLTNTTIPLGQKMYLYAKNGSLVFDSTGPAYAHTGSDKARKADGTPKSYEVSYSILEGMSNPYFAYGIHDRLFTTWGDNENGDNFSGDITGKNKITLTPSSGAFGLLGIVKLTEESFVNGSLGFNNRD